MIVSRSRMFQLSALQTGPARMPQSYAGETVFEIKETPQQYRVRTCLSAWRTSYVSV